MHTALISALAVLSSSAVTFAVLEAAASPSSSTHAATPRTAAITSTARTPLDGSILRPARGARGVGPLDPSRVLTGASLVFRRSPAQEALARIVLQDLENPLSPNYHRWLTPEEYAARFGAAPADVARISTWLASHGVTVLGPSRNATRLFFSGTVDQIEHAFQTELDEYDVRGERHFALATTPSLPSELAPAVLGLRGLDDLHRLPTRRGRTRPPSSLPVQTADGGVADTLALAPLDWATIYGVAPLYAQGFTGAGQKIAIVGESDYIEGDVVAFRKAFGLDASNLPTRVLLPNSGNPVIGIAPDTFSEAELDLEWAGGIARDASLTYVFVGDSLAYSFMDAIAYAIDQGGFQVISASFVGPEATNGVTRTDLIDAEVLGDAASMEGTTLVVASGDTGAGGFDCGDCPFGEVGLSVSFPASIPSIVAVGGTEFSWGDPLPEPLNAIPSATYWAPSDAGYSARAYVPETSWNDYGITSNDGVGGAGASGGGASVVYPMPYWQVGQVEPGSFRRVPDIALAASWSQVPYIVLTTPQDFEDAGVHPSASGGTSAATPSFAGLLAIVNQATGGRGFGDVNPLLYAINSQTAGTPSAVFHDITSGTNITSCTMGTLDCPASPPYQYGYSAGPGYDMVTGLGSPIATSLVTALETLTPTVTSLTIVSSGTTEGSTVTLTATVASSATSNAMTGDVTFYLRAGDPLLAGANVSVVGTIQPASVGHETGTATATAIAPPGLAGSASVTAFYAGDAHYRASWSAPTEVAATSSLTVSPTSIVLGENQISMLTTTGGVPPISWVSTACAYPIVDAETATTASINAGPEPCVGGVVYAIDSEGAVAAVSVTVLAPSPADAGADANADAGLVDAAADVSAADGGPSDAGEGAKDASGDSGAPRDASVRRSVDASVSPRDAGERGRDGGAGASPSSGCTCTAAGAEEARPPASAVVTVSAWLLGLVALRRRGGKLAHPARVG
jgi:hypothetical protein